MHTLTHTRWNQIGALSSLRPANQSLAGFTQCRVDDELILSDLGGGMLVKHEGDKHTHIYIRSNSSRQAFTSS